jgi:hypothetical protein
MDEPIITTHEETVHVNPQIDGAITNAEQKAKLDESFENFFQEQDAKEEATTPEAKGPSKDQESISAEQPAPEPKKPKAERKRKPAAEDIPEVPEEVADEPDELEKYQPHPQSSQTVRNDFKGLKSAARTFKQKAQAWETLEPALKELGIQIPDNPEELASVLKDARTRISALKNGALPEAVTKELDELRQIAVSVGILKSHAFCEEFVKPRDALYHETISEMAQYFDAPQEQIQKDFLDPLRKDFTPHDLSAEWWDQQIGLMTKAPHSIKAKIQQKVANLLLLQERHDSKARELTSSPQNFHTWQEGKRREADEAFGRSVQARVESTLEKVSPFYFELRKRVLAGDKAAITEFAPVEEKFRNFLNTVRSGDANSTTDIAEENVEMGRRLSELSDVADRLKEAEDENDKLRDELKRQRKTKDAPFRNRNVPTKQQAPTALPHSARKSLQSAFERWEP